LGVAVVLLRAKYRMDGLTDVARENLQKLPRSDAVKHWRVRRVAAVEVDLELQWQRLWVRKDAAPSPRQRVEYLATVVSGDGAARHCVVTEISDGGVRITAHGYKVPDEFMLRFSGNGPAKAYKAIWRIGHDVGARLIGAQSAEI
jgi:hypothetical protein